MNASPKMYRTRRRRGGLSVPVLAGIRSQTPGHTHTHNGNNGNKQRNSYEHYIVTTCAGRKYGKNAMNFIDWLLVNEQNDKDKFIR